MELKIVRLEDIDPHPNQPRTKLEHIAELALSIGARGVIVPPIVVANGGRYLLVDGQRRCAAAKKAKLTEIQVNVAGDWTEASMLEDAMATAVQRDNLTALEISNGLQTLLDFGVDRKEVMKVTGHTEAELAFAEKIA
ncbi:MAG TPA: ParB/RepB/Spo0J family partition protein, partial [Candidatus Limnocylindrales bacterium]